MVIEETVVLPISWQGWEERFICCGDEQLCALLKYGAVLSALRLIEAEVPTASVVIFSVPPSAVTVTPAPASPF